MLWFMICMFALLAVLFVVAIWRDRRAGRLTDGGWTLRTSLRAKDLNDLIVGGMKGADADAKVRRSGSTYEREVDRASGEETNSATIVVSVEAQEAGVTEVHCEITDWQAPQKYGLRNATAVYDSAKRVRGVLRKIRRADPSAELLGKPGRG
jgi:hypothetical protein